MKSTADLVGKQRTAVGTCLGTLREEGHDAVWHWNKCDCCVSVHARVDHPEFGFIVNADGDVFYETTGIE